MKFEYQDCIDDYLLNRMSDEERVAFEAECEKNSELQKQLQFTESVRVEKRRRNEMLAKMKEWEDDYAWNNKRKVAATVAYNASDCCSAPPLENIYMKKHVRKRQIFYWLSAVVVVCIVGIIIVHSLFFKTIGKDLNYVSNLDFSKIEKLIAQNEYEEALAQIAQESMILEEIRQNDVTLGCKSSGYGKSQQEMEMKEKQNNLLWLKVQALLGLNKQDEALVVLEELSGSEGYYQKLADSLYRQINR